MASIVDEGGVVDAAMVPPRVGSSGRRRRRVSSRGEVAAMVAIAGLGALAAILLSDAAPTTTAWVDAIQRGAFVVLLVVSGARARRWSLVLGAGLTAAFAVGDLRIGALATLVIVLYLVLADRRSRVLDSLAGGLVGLAALALEVGGPTGLELVVGAIATLPILWSAYRYTSTRVRRRWRRGLIAVVVFSIVATGVTAVAAAASLGSLQDGVDATRRGVDAAAVADTAAAAAAFDEGVDGFGAADGLVGSWWASGSRLVPVVGANVAAVQESVALGGQLTRAARAVALDVDFDAIQRPDGGVDVAELASFEPSIRQASTAAQRATGTLGELQSSWIVGPLATRIDELAVEVADLGEQSELALLGVTDGPALLGADGPRRYLVLLGNPAELRDIGGHIGNWAELVVDQGRLEVVSVGSPTELALPPDEATAAIEAGLPPWMRALQPTRFPQNWGGDPDMATVAGVSTELFELATGRTVDGVLYADTAAFAALVGLTGPVDVPGLPEPFQLTEENAESFLTRDQFLRYERASEADAALEVVIESVLERLTSIQLPAPAALGDRFGPIVAEGRLVLASNQEGDTALLERLGLDGTLQRPDGGDVLSVVQRNAGPSKIDSFLSREIDVDLEWNPSTGDVISVVTVELANAAPAEGLNELVLGNSTGAPLGTNVTDLAVVTPFRSTSVRVDGATTGSQPLRDGDLWRHTVRVDVAPGGTTTVTFRLAGQVDPGPDYTLAFVGQPIMGENTLSAALSTGAGPASVEAVSGIDTDGRNSLLDAGTGHVFSWTSGK